MVEPAFSLLGGNSPAAQLPSARFEEFHVHVPAGPGIGVTLDEEKLRRYARR
jgi:L-alanine-DL-glutamate epimerase-like enolase superfamily enzyme